MNEHTVQEIRADVAVAGAGTAGIGAALATAGRGLSTVLLESSSKIGGVMSVCPGMPIGAAYPCGFSVGGLLEEFVQKLYCMKPPAAEKRECALKEFGPEILYDYEIALAVLYGMLENAGVQLFLNTVAAETVMEGNKITGILCRSRTRALMIRAKVFIDCSGDGDLAESAGVPFETGNKDGNMMGATLSFIMDNADWKKIFEGNPDPYFTEAAAKGIAGGKIHPDLYKLYMMKGFHKNSVFFNSVTIEGVNGCDQQSVTGATAEARRRCLRLAEFVKEAIPGFENARLLYLGPSVGIRETRKFEGLYRLTIRDLADSAKFPDGIVACDNPIDDVFRGGNVMTHNSVVDKGQYYTIPFRCMVPKKIDNLLFAGRLISADPDAFASVRGMSQCMIMGQACGTAAEQVIKSGIPVQQINTRELVASLLEQGVNGIGAEAYGK